MSELWVRVMNFVLENEGGLADDPHDPGGLTKYGISAKTYPGEDIAALTRARAIELYRRDFWDRHGYGLLRDEGLVTRVMDLAVLAGAPRANRMLQRAYNRLLPTDPREGARYLAEDGVVGPKTLAAVNGYRHPRALVLALQVEAALYLAGLDKPRFLAGWFLRLDREPPCAG